MSVIDGNGAISSALIGMGSASRIMEHAAKNIANRGAGIQAINPNKFGVPRDNVTLSSQSQGLLETSSIEKDIIRMMEAGTTYSANAKVVKAADSMLGSLLEMVA